MAPQRLWVVGIRNRDKRFALSYKDNNRIGCWKIHLRLLMLSKFYNSQPMKLVIWQEIWLVTSQVNTAKQSRTKICQASLNRHRPKFQKPQNKWRSVALPAKNLLKLCKGWKWWLERRVRNRNCQLMNLGIRLQWRKYSSPHRRNELNRENLWNSSFTNVLTQTRRLESLKKV